MKDRSRALQLAATGSLAVVAVLLWYFHDQFWWPADEGVYAYVAQRILAGDRLHLDLIDLHGGYVNYLHALAFTVFGQDLLSLRYPLVALTLLQSGLVFWLSKNRGPLVAMTAALAAGALSFIQFLNPSANWYALFVCFVILAVSTKIDATARSHLVLLGFLLGLCFLTRQLSGVLLALGVLTWLMLRMGEPDARPAVAGRLFTAFLAIVLAGYLASKSSAAAIVLVGVFPMWLIALALMRVNLDARTLGRTLGWLLIGGLIAAMPLAVYYAMNGALLPWLKDIFLTALLIHGQDFIGQDDYISWLTTAFSTLFSAPSFVAGISALGWIAIILIVPGTGYLCVRYLRNAADPTGVHALPVIAPFWALVAVHYQITIYLFFALPVVVVAFIHLAPKRLAVISVLLLSSWSIVFQAGQPLSRSYADILEGKRVSTDREAGLPRVSLRIAAKDQADFSALISYIENSARPDELLMTLPMDPELNFMTGRRSPVRYYATQLGLVTAADVRDTLERLQASAPIFIVHRRVDKYLTPLSSDLLDEIRSLSPAPVSVGPFDVYRLPLAGERIP